MTKYYVYIIKCEKWKKGIFQKYLYYTGMTSDPKRRLKEHQAGIKSNWMVRNSISPKYIVYLELVGTNYYTTLVREKQIKQMSLMRKLNMIEDYNG